MGSKVRRILLAVLALAVAGTGCARKKHTRLIPLPPAPPGIGSTENGLASWYGHPYHGRAAASGEIYDMEKLTAAHRTLPFNTWVRVHDLDNGKDVEVRINDRGPFVDGRVIDLSHAAARAIEMIGPGVAKVKVEIIRTPANAEAPRFAVQVGAFRDQRSARRVMEEMQQKFGPARLVLREGRPSMWRVLVGDETSEDAATGLAGRIRSDGGHKTAAFVVRLDS
jgi:rare lipoprotein A